MSRRALWAVVLVLAGVGRAGAVDPRSGGTALLNMGDARLTALGEAGAALPGDLSGATVNPALLAALEGDQFLTQFQSSPGDVKTGLLSYGRGSVWAGWSMTVAYSDAGSITLVPAGGGVGDTRRAQQDLVGSLAGALALSDGIRLGGALKGLRSTLVEDYTASAVAGDLGVLVNLPPRGWRLGASVQNMGSEIAYKSEGDPLPLFYRGGLSYQFSTGKDDFMPVDSALGGFGSRGLGQSYFWLGADALVDRWGGTTAALGFEWDYARRAVLRAGGQAGNGNNGFTGGVGFYIQRWRLDYSFQLVDDWNPRHRATLSYLWREES